jgi:hypothetical protein
MDHFRAIGQLFCCAAVLLSVAASAGALPASYSDVDLQLVPAVDASGSVDQTRHDLQKGGYAAAFRDQQVLNAIRSGPAQAIAVTMVEWTGPRLQVQVVPWTRINDVASAAAFADAIIAAPRSLFGGGTSISGDIDYAMTLWRHSPYHGARRVIDISGDGSNNRGLPILALDPLLDRYYEANVIGGPRAFVIAAESYNTFAAAIRRKLIP